MRTERLDNGDLLLVVSRRNLLSLLAKLDGHPPGSMCTIGSPRDSDSPPVWLKAEEDDVHYSHPSREGAPPGPMHSDTEAMLRG